MIDGNQPTRVIRAVDTEQDVRSLRELLRDYVTSWHESEQDWPPEDRELVAQAPQGFTPPRGGAWVALEEQEPVGCVLLKRLDDSRAEILKLFVRQIARQRGLGQQLMMTALDYACRIGCSEAVLSVAHDRAAARALYRRMGFVEFDASSPLGMVSMRRSLGTESFENTEKSAPEHGPAD